MLSKAIWNSQDLCPMRSKWQWCLWYQKHSLAEMRHQWAPLEPSVFKDWGCSGICFENISPKISLRVRQAVPSAGQLKGASWSLRTLPWAGWRQDVPLALLGTQDMTQYNHREICNQQGVMLQSNPSSAPSHWCLFSPLLCSFLSGTTGALGNIDFPAWLQLSAASFLQLRVVRIVVWV